MARTIGGRLGATAVALSSLVGLTLTTAPSAAGPTPAATRLIPVDCGVASAPVRFGCAVQLVEGANGRVLTSSSPQGLTPADLQDAYKVTAAAASRGAGQVVGVVIAYDDPNAEADLAVYRSAFGLPPCTTANRCFRKVNGEGQAGALPAPNAQWAVETSNDIDVVSAVCPRCHILLVEADDNSTGSFGRAENTAVALGATVIGNSWGGVEWPGETKLDPNFAHPGIPLVFAGGDNQYNGEWYPATSPFVVAVGGTMLARAGNARGWSETVADGTGSGCSLYEAKPTWQHDSGCIRRTANDVAAVYESRRTLSSPDVSGVAIYDTFKPLLDPSTYEALAVQQLSLTSGWTQGGGTSTATQVVAAIYALAGNGRRLHYAASLYTHSNQLFDVTTGSNGDGTLPSFSVYPLQDVVLHDCGTYLCRGEPGYDGPTGNGTPDGLSAF